MKSIYQKLSEVIEQLSPSQLRSFKEVRALAKSRSGSMPTAETQLNMAEKLLTGRPTRESRGPIQRHNGASINLVENDPFRHDHSATPINEGSNKNEFAKLDKMLFDDDLAKGRITEAEYRKLLNLPPKEYEALTEREQLEYKALRATGVEEADCFTLLKMNNRTFFTESVLQSSISSQVSCERRNKFPATRGMMGWGYSPWPHPINKF